MSKSNETTPNVPTLRFNEYDDDWRQYSFYQCVSIPNKMVNPTDKKYCDLPHIGAANIEKGTGQLLPYNTAKEDALISGKYLFFENDVIYSKVRPYFAKATLPKFAGLCSADAYPLHPNAEIITPYFLLQSILHNRFTKFTSSISKRTGMPKVNREDLSFYQFYVPSIKEQKKINTFLNLIDKRIRVQNKIISDLKVLKKELCNRYFKSVHNDTSLEYVTLKDILTERKEYCSKDGTYTHGTLSKEGVSPKTERYDRDFLVKNEDKQYKVTHFNDICYNPANLKFGVICRNTYGDLIFSPIYVTFEIADTVYPAYIELFLTNTNFIGRIRRYEQGTVYERMAVSPEDFLSYETRIPTYEEQVKFADKIQRIQDKIELETIFLNSLQKQRKYLLNAMFI